MKREQARLILAAVCASAWISPLKARAQVEAGDLGFETDLRRNTQYFNMETQELSQRIAADKKMREEEAMAAVQAEIERFGKIPYFLRMELSGSQYYSLHRVSLNPLGEAKLSYDLLERQRTQLSKDLRGYKSSGKISSTLIEQTEAELSKIEAKQALLRKVLAAAGTHAGDLQEGRDYKVTKTNDRAPK